MEVTQKTVIIAYHKLDLLRRWMKNTIAQSTEHTMRGSMLRDTVYGFKNIHGHFRYETQYFYVNLDSKRGVWDAAGLQAQSVHLVDGIMDADQNNYLQSRMRVVCQKCNNAPKAELDYPDW